jgi:hypothetical protein
MDGIEINDFNKEFPSLKDKELTRENIKSSCFDKQEIMNFDKQEIMKILLEFKKTIEEGFKKHESSSSIIKVKKMIDEELEDLK